MNEIQFVERLREELGNSQRWPQIQSVTSSTSDCSVAPNELLVQPVAVDAEPVVLRVTVELLTASGRTYT